MKKLFILHGWAYSTEKWLAFSAQLRARDIEPVLLKIPGLTEPSDKVWDIKDYVKWLDKQLRGVKNPVILGHSNGGRIALNYAQTHPGRLHRLILIDSAGVPHNEFIPRTKLWILRLIARIGKPFARFPGLKQTFYKLIGARDYYEAPDNMKQTMQNMLHADNLIDYSKIQVPTTIIWGRNDSITPVKDGRKLHRLVTGSTLNVIQGARHMPQSSHPEDVTDIVVAVLES